MLVFGWLLFGLAGLFAASAVLSLGQKPGSYVSPYGALNFLLTGKVTASQFPWGQASLTGIAESAGKSVVSGLGDNLLGGLIP
jgi:hypothetical protein